MIALRHQHQEQQAEALNVIFALLQCNRELQEGFDRQAYSYFQAHHAFSEAATDRDSADVALQGYVQSFDSLRTELRAILETGRDDVRGTRWFAAEDVRRMKELIG